MLGEMDQRITLEPGNAAARIASIVFPYLQQGSDVVVRPGGIEIRKLGVSGLAVISWDESTLTESFIRTAILELAGAGCIPQGSNLSLKVNVCGQPARLVLSPWVGLFVGPGPEILYRCLPTTES